VQTSGSAPEQTNPYSFKQLEQPSFKTEFPSSHSSLGDRFPFPQEEVHEEGLPEQLNPYSIWPDGEQPSPDKVLESSQISDPTLIPSPYLGTQISLVSGPPPEQVHVERTDIQSEEQPSPSSMFPSSQISGELLH